MSGYRQYPSLDEPINKPAAHFSIERLPNGYIRVYDYNCQWDGLYNEDGTFRHGQARGYERQVKTWVAISDVDKG